MSLFHLAYLQLPVVNSVEEWDEAQGSKTVSQKIAAVPQMPLSFKPIGPRGLPLAPSVRRGAHTAISITTKICLGQEILPEVMVLHLSRPEILQTFPLKSLVKLTERGGAAQSADGTGSSQPILFGDIEVAATEHLSTEKVSVAEWQGLSLLSQINNKLLATSFDYYPTHGSVPPNQCFLNIKKLALSPCEPRGRINVPDPIVRNSQHLAKLQEVLRGYQIKVDKISSHFCEDIRRSRTALELMSSIGPMPLAIAVYKGRLSTVFDQLDINVTDKGVLGAF